MFSLILLELGEDDYRNCVEQVPFLKIHVSENTCISKRGVGVDRLKWKFKFRGAWGWMFQQRCYD